MLTLLLNQFGYSLDAIGSIMIADAFNIYGSIFFGVVARDCELFDISHEIKF